MNDAKRHHIQRVKELPCSLCGHGAPSSAHHILQGRTPGRKVGDWLTIPLCYECHQGKQGIHGDKTLWRIYKKSEFECLDETLAKLYGGRK